MVSLRSLDRLAEDEFILRCALSTDLFELVKSNEDEILLIKHKNSERCYSFEDFMRSAFSQGMRDGLKSNGLHNPHSPYTQLAQEYNYGYAKGKIYSGQFQLAMQLTMQCTKREWN